MVGDISFSFIITVKDGGMLSFRDALESVREMTYEHMNVHILDATSGRDVENFSEMVASGDPRVIYHRLQSALSFPALWNQGIRYSKDDYIVFIGNMVRLDPRFPDAMADQIRERLEIHVAYTDYDELVRDTRANPQFLPDFNLELLRHTNYIGDTFCVRRTLFREIGMFTERLSFSFTYDFFLRASESGIKITHIPTLLWHRRVDEVSTVTRELKEFLKRSIAEHKTVLQAHLQRKEIEADITTDKSNSYFKIAYKGDDYRSHRREYLLIREEGIKVKRFSAVSLLYGHLKQPDVAIVGAKFVRSGNVIDNCGYIFGKDGMIYPACHGQSASSEGLYGRIAIAREVSMVDPEYCMIDAKFFRKAGGFDRSLSGREMMMDLCLKAKKGGLRVIYEPEVVVRCGKREVISSEVVHDRFAERWRSVIEKGDPCYSPNLPVGLSNYSLDT